MAAHVYFCTKPCVVKKGKGEAGKTKPEKTTIASRRFHPEIHEALQHVLSSAEDMHFVVALVTNEFKSFRF